MHPILAGIISGAIMGLGFDVLTIMAMQRLRGDDAPPWLQSALRQASFIKLVAPMAVFTHSAWTLAGLGAGAVYWLLDDGGRSSGLGSPFLWFTLAVPRPRHRLPNCDGGGGRSRQGVDAALAGALRRHLRLAPAQPRGVGANDTAVDIVHRHVPKY